MKYIIGVSALAVLLFAGCNQKEDVPFEELKKPIPMEFSALMEEGAVTKTVLDGSGTAADRQIHWMPLDSIKISNGGAFSRFVYRGETRTDNAIFRGTIAEGEMYYAVYPASSSVSMSEGTLSLSLPTTQRYVAESFDNGAYPMLAKSESSTLTFLNLCGALVLNLKGAVTVSKITFEATDASSAAMPVAGAATVDMSYTTAPTLTMSAAGEKIVVLDCGNGVTLNTETAVPFYIALPPATYSNFTLNIYTTDSRLMTKTASNLTIARSRGASTSALTFAENSGAVDLSAAGTANCYIVSRAGNFSFNASVIGNGEAGLLPQYSQDVKKFHTTTTDIIPASAQVLWQDVSGLVTAVSVSGGRISFTTSSDKGNAVIAAYSGEECTGDIIWSWHIWCTDQPQGEEYKNHINRRFVVLDRNLGATSADPGSTNEERLATYGLLYQWGRKDPFPGSASVSSSVEKTLYGAVSGITKTSTSSELGTIENVVKNPAIYYYNNSSPYDWYYSSSRNGYLWGNPFGNAVLADKSIYDPCPYGYMVAPVDTWTRFTTTGNNSTVRNEFNVSGSFSYGWRFYNSEDGSGTTSWYPYAGKRGYGNGILALSGDYWNSYYGGLGIGSSEVGALSDSDKANAYSVRCVQEFSSMLVSAPILTTVTPSEITIATAASGGNITSDGGADVTARGVCWSTSPNPLITDAHTSDGAGKGSFTSAVTGLNQGTTYYLRAYATSQVGTNYGTHYSFTTPAFATVSSLSVVCNTATTATGRGNVTAIGDADVTERGVCWSTAENPTISDSKSAAATSGLGIFSAQITGLTSGTAYHMRAYATNQYGTAYGDNITFTAGVPTVITSEITNITTNSAVSGGTTAYTDAITACGVCWSTSPNPTVSDSKTEDTMTSGGVTSSLTSLLKNTTYYVRAYVITGAGTIYGEEKIFTTDCLVGFASLSRNGEANCYIVTAAGNYSFNGSVIGNGAEGLLPAVAQSVKKFHTEDVSITPLSAQVLWQDVEGLITSPSINEGQVTFTASSSKGNAVIAVYDNANPSASDAKILWSWHIWCTDQPATQNYVNFAGSSFTLLDRNLGATSAVSTDGTATYGLHYQWGRKDPFSRNDSHLTKEATSSDKGTISNTISHPTYYYYNSSDPSDWHYAERNNYLWGNPEGYNYTSNYTAAKSVYDPCPPGYMVAPKDTWTGFSSTGGNTSTSSRFNVSGTFSNGWTFYNSAQGSGTTSWYPAAGYRRYDGGFLNYSGSYGSCWSSGAGGLYFGSGSVYPLTNYHRAYGFSVRCVRGETFSSQQITAPAVTTTSATSITSATASSGGTITSDGGASVTARGVCWSTSENPTISDSKTTDGTGTGTFTSAITGLTAGTTYYIRAYATNRAGTSYGEQKSFTTLPSGSSDDNFNFDDGEYQW